MGAGVIPFAEQDDKVCFLFQTTFSGRKTGHLIDFGGGLGDDDQYVLNLAKIPGRTISEVCESSKLPAINTCRSLFFLILKDALRIDIPATCAVEATA